MEPTLCEGQGVVRTSANEIYKNGSRTKRIALPGKIEEAEFMVLRRTTSAR